MSLSSWNYINASVIGTSHVERGTPCQDYHVCHIVSSGSNEILVIVVADGAGSATEGGIGAEIACTEFVKGIESFFQGGDSISDLTLEFGRQWIKGFQAKITETAEADGKKTRDYACTMLAAIVEEESAVFYQIGDGAIIYSAQERPDLYYMGVIPAESLYANMTDFLTDTDALEKLKCEFLSQPVQDLAMFTDGLQTLALSYGNGQPEPHAQFIKPMLAPLKNGQVNVNLQTKLADFLNSKVVNGRTDDDKTIVLASRIKAQEIPADDAIAASEKASAH